MFDGVKDKCLYSFHRLAPLKGIKIVKIICGPIACHSFAVSADGTCFAWGRNEDGQLGLGDTINRYNPTPITKYGKEAKGAALPVIAGGSCGSAHTILFSKDGNVYSCGDSKNGKLGLGPAVAANAEPVTIPTKIEARNIISASCGREFSVIVQGETGKVYSFGNPEFGQLGNGTDGKTLERAGKFTFANVLVPTLVSAFDKFGTKIVEVASGANHSCARDTEGRLFTWGFGGYGRLGHKDNKDHHLPTPVELFNFVPPPPNPSLPKFMQRVQPKIRAKRIACGSTATFAITQEPFSVLYMWGITKKSGEAVMYPTMVDDISSYQIRDVASGQSSTIVAPLEEKILVTWGASPTYGELGLGETKKSSTRAESVSDLHGLEVIQVAMGYGHSLAIVSPPTAASQATIDKLPVFSPPELDGSVVADLSKKRASGGDDEEEDAGAVTQGKTKKAKTAAASTAAKKKKGA